MHSRNLEPKLRKINFFSLALASFMGGASPLYAAGKVDLVDWKLFFNQVFALEISKELRGLGRSETEIRSVLREHTAYTRKTFTETIADVLQATSSAEAYTRRRKIYNDEQNYEKISQVDFTSSIPRTIQSDQRVGSYLTGINRQRNRIIPPGENFFQTDEGKNAVRAITFSNDDDGSQEVALVFVPGYAAHTIKFEIFPEIVADMNQFWGRPSSRPILDEGNGIDVKYEDFSLFYARNQGTSRPFDILHPAGWEMGNTIGLNAETADLMANWIAKLPESYKNKKLILFGYSKGAPAILEMLQRHPELKPRVIGIVTYAGVIQGTHIARSALDTIQGVLGPRNIGDLLNKVQAKGTEASIYAIAPFLSPFDLSFLTLPKIKSLIDIYGFDTKNLSNQAERVFNGREVRELLDGVIDLSPLTRSMWNLRFLNNNLVEPGTFFFNSSAVTDISSFASKSLSLSQTGQETPLLAPNLKGNHELDWGKFSLDAWFLYLSSIPGFQLAPGGLYDTQVDLQHTKSPWIDQSPLSFSLTQTELETIWNTVDIRNKLQKSGVANFDEFKSVPRNSLYLKSTINNINSFDLGEIKGHHWSLFLQAFRPPKSVSNEFYSWPFPRKAYMRAMLQTIALFNIVKQSN